MSSLLIFAAGVAVGVWIGHDPKQALKPVVRATLGVAEWIREVQEGIAEDIEDQVAAAKHRKQAGEPEDVEEAPSGSDPSKNN